MFDMWSTVTSKLEAHTALQTNVQTNGQQNQSSGSIKGKWHIFFFLLFTSGGTRLQGSAWRNSSKINLKLFQLKNNQIILVLYICSRTLINVIGIRYAILSSKSCCIHGLCEPKSARSILRNHPFSVRCKQSASQ